MKTNRIYALFLVSAGLLFNPLLLETLLAHTSLGVNGAVSLNLSSSTISVEYQIECGALTTVDVRPKIDRNSDGALSKNELEAFNKATQNKLTEAKSPCQIFMDGKPMKLFPEKVEFILPADSPAGTVFLKFWLNSKQSLPPGTHKLVLTGNICPVDAELLGLPAESPTLGHGALVRILRVTATGDPAVQFSMVSSGFIRGQGPNAKVQCFLNNLVKQVQINFNLAGSKAGQTQSPSQPAAVEEPFVGATGGENAYNRGQEPQDWWNEIRRMHGHVGPWNVLGWRIGQAALREFKTQWGLHELEIICYVPLRTPYTCLVDGVVVGTGNTMGRLDLRLAEVFALESIHVAARRQDGQGAVLLFKPRLAYLRRIDAPKLEELEKLSRESGTMAERDMFDIQRIGPSK